MAQLSSRLRAIVDALPVRPGMRVLEIGCGTGAAARELSKRVGGGRVLGIDRSQKAIAIATRGSGQEIAGGSLEYRRVAIEDFVLDKDEEPYDLAFAIRVGVLDGRHLESETLSLARIKAALKPDGRFFLDGGTPLRQVRL